MSMLLSYVSRCVLDALLQLINAAVAVTVVRLSLQRLQPQKKRMKRWPIAAKSHCSSIVLQVLASQVDASATLELLIRSFKNPDSKKEDGSRDCDGGSQCDHVFRFALDRGDRCVTGLICFCPFISLSCLA